MKRRTFLQTGAAAFLGSGTYSLAPGSEPLPVSIWLSDGASRYDDLADRVLSYLEVALRDAGLDPRFTVVDEPVSLPAESGYDVLAKVWPRRVMTGRLGLGDLTPVDGVNLLITDGNPRDPPSGYGLPEIAATTGARFLAEMDSPDELPAIVPYSMPAITTQLLLHEVGHALGLGHEHGRVSHDGDRTAVTSPMLSAYAWQEPGRYLPPTPSTATAGADTDCSSDPVPARPKRWRLSLRYGRCSVSQVARRHG